MMSGVRKVLCGAAVVLLGAPAAFGPPETVLIAASAVAAVLTVLLPRPAGRVPALVAAWSAPVLSLGADVLHSGRQGINLLWLPVEFTALLVLTARLVRRGTGRSVPAAVAALATVLVPLRFTLRDPATEGEASVLLAVAALVPVLGAVGVGLRLRWSDARARQVVLDARREQRLHMARMLHDYVAHELTGILMEVQAARVTPYDPKEYGELLARLEDSGLRALDRMDETLAALRRAEAPAPDPRAPVRPVLPERLHGLDGLPALVDRFGESSSLPTSLDCDETLVNALALHPDADEAAYSLVLEALTNVRRHASGAAGVRVAARREGSLLRVSVTDCADGSAPRGRRDDGGRWDRRGGGTGLSDLERRFASLGGELSAGPHGDGWRVSGTLPLAQRAEEFSASGV
ncbi:sensor histidine kinase [Streptomyces sp. NPDC088745]|uniref:sensor histidine kinase n=1 Tax=Streptomyces sp. NPDC088745 TaxID=3365884 RepID=UPI003825B386